jgi:hypothetical protein
MWAILERHGQQVEIIPGVPARMLDILQACLAADPSQRLPSAAALRDELAALLGGEHGRAPAREWQVPATPSERLADSAAWPRTGSPPESLAGSAGGAGPTSADALGSAARAGRWRPSLTLAAVGGGVAVAVAAALLVVPRLLSPGGGPAGNGPAGASTPEAIDVFGVATTTEHCPAALVTSAGAQCVTKPECWFGVNDFNGVISAAAVPCNEAHSWQTFAIAMMPRGSATFNVNIVQADPIVQALCSAKVLLASRTGAALRVPESAWQIQVMPPDETDYNDGVRTVRCLAGLDFDQLKSAQFGP